MTDDEKAELAAIQRGDATAFAGWLARNEHRLRAGLRSFAARVDVESVVQESLLRLWHVAPKLEPRDGDSDPLLRFALRIARNLAIDEVRRGDPRPEPEEPDPPPPPDPLLRELIARCLQLLPRQPRRAIEKRIESFGGDPDASLAAALSMSLNTFLKNVGRARALIAKCLLRNGVDVGAART